MHIWIPVIVVAAIIFVVFYKHRVKRLAREKEERHAHRQEQDRQRKKLANDFYVSIKNDDEKLSDSDNTEKLYHLYYHAGMTTAYVETEIAMAKTRQEIRQLIARDNTRANQMRILCLAKDAPSEVTGHIDNFDFDKRLADYTRMVKADITLLVHSLGNVESAQPMRMFLHDPVYSLTFGSGHPNRKKRSEWSMCIALGVAPDLALTMQRWNEWLVRHEDAPVYRDFINMKSEFGPGELYRYGTMTAAVGDSLLHAKYILAMCASNDTHMRSIGAPLRLWLGYVVEQLEGSTSRS
jgi:hypothetical protein